MTGANYNTSPLNFFKSPAQFYSKAHSSVHISALNISNSPAVCVQLVRYIGNRVKCSDFTEIVQLWKPTGELKDLLCFLGCSHYMTFKTSTQHEQVVPLGTSCYTSCHFSKPPQQQVHSMQVTRYARNKKMYRYVSGLLETANLEVSWLDQDFKDEESD